MLEVVVGVGGDAGARPPAAEELLPVAEVDCPEAVVAAQLGENIFI